jgi:PKD repeat protein
MKATTISFGDGSQTVRHQASLVHRYTRPGIYTVTIHTSSQVGNRAVFHILVKAR